MLIPALSGFIVSVDAFFIGLSLGLEGKCKFIYIVIINAFLLALCILGFLLAGHIYELIPFEPDYIVGFAFIALGVCTIVQHFMSKLVSTRRESDSSRKSILLIGLLMSVEAMFITMGITFIFLPYSTVVIPLSVAIAHFLYSALTFHLAKCKYARRIPTALSYVVSGLALIGYGMMALFVDIRL